MKAGRILILLFMIVSLSVSSRQSHAFGTAYDTDLVARIKPYPIKQGVKPTSDYIKTAYVEFLPNSGNSWIKFSCPAGHEMKNGKCEVKECRGYPYVTTAERANCEDIETCQSGDVLKFRCTSCKSGMVSDGNGGCICDESIYIYNSEDNACAYKVDESKRMCEFVRSNGTTIKYYEDCICPSEWVECSYYENKMGLGSVCISGGELYYQYCDCLSGYDQACIVAVDESNYCELNGVKYYRRCLDCDFDAGELNPEANYWCTDAGKTEFSDVPMSAFEVVCGLYGNLEVCDERKK